MQRRVRRIGTCLAIRIVPVFVLLLAGSAPARAAQEDELGDPTPATGKIEEITVTARKREELLRETPVAISVLSGEDLRELGARSLEDIGDAIPNLVFKQGTGKSASVTIRGLGQRDPRTFLDPSVGIYIDGVYTARADGPLISTLDVERIEVLRGPQGTLYGKNSIGGAINFITRKPGPELEALAELVVGNYDTLETRLMLNLPLVADRLFSRWGFTSEHSEGWSENRITGQRYNDNSLLLGVGQLRLRASDSLVWDIYGNYSKENEKPRAAQCRVSDPQNIFVGAFSEGGRIAGSSFDHGGNCALDSTLDTDEFSSNVRGHYELEAWAVSSVVTFDWEGLFPLEDVTFQSITGYRGQDVSQTADPDGSASLVLDFLQTDPTRQWQVSQELRAAGEAWEGRVAYALGFFGFWEETKDGRGLSRFGPDGGFFVPCGFFGLPGCPMGNEFAVPFPFVPVTRVEVSTPETDVESYAGYGQASVDLTDWLQLTGGVRYTWERKKVALAGVGQGKDTFDHWTPMGTLKFTAPEDLLSGTPLDFGMIYFNFARGFKSGGFNGTPPVENILTGIPGPLDPFAQEELDSWEIGFKLSGLGDRVALSAAFFLSDYKDIQLTASAISGFLTIPRIENAGKATIQGFEVEVQARPFSGLELQASVGFTDADFDEFDDLRLITNPIGIPIGVETVDRSDEDFWNTPKVQFFASLQYRFEFASAGLPAWGSLTPRVDMSYTSSSSYHFQRAGFFAPGKPFEQGSYALWNARLTWLWRDGHVRVSAYVKNAFDRRYFTGAIDLTETFGSGAVFFADRRRTGVDVSYRY